MTKAEDAPWRPNEEERLAVPVIEARDLFVEGIREVLIEHEGVRYRLRLTRRNKLILQK